MTVERYEQVRADWLLAHEARWHLSDRRMATELKRKAARTSRSASGAIDSSHHEGRIKPIHARFLAASEDYKDKMARFFFLVLVAVPGLALTIGPALALSHVLYSASTEATLAKGSVPRATPWLGLAALVVAGGAAAGLLVPSLLVVATLWRWPSIVLDVHWGHVGLIYGWVQLAIALLLVAWHVRRHGWPGVVARTAPTISTMPVAPAVPAVPTAPAAPAAPTPTVETREPEEPQVPMIPDLPTIPTDDEFEDDVAFEDEPVYDDEITTTTDRSAS